MAHELRNLAKGGVVTTEDDTPVNVTIETPPANSGIAALFQAVGRGVTSQSLDVILIRQAFKVDAGGNITEPFAQEKVWIKKEDAAWDANVVLLAGDTQIACQVTGDAAENVLWVVACTAVANVSV